MADVGKYDADGTPIPTWTGYEFGKDCPSMDNKDVPSPPICTTEEYDWNLAHGFVRGGKPQYGSKGGKVSAE